MIIFFSFTIKYDIIISHKEVAYENMGKSMD